MTRTIVLQKNMGDITETTSRFYTRYFPGHLLSAWTMITLLVAVREIFGKLCSAVWLWAARVQCVY